MHRASRWARTAARPAVQRRDGSYSIYEGPFADKEGVWWHLTYDASGGHLKRRRPPMSDAEIKALCERVMRQNDPALLPAIDMAIEDALQAGRTDLAYMLMGRAEALSPAAKQAGAILLARFKAQRA